MLPLILTNLQSPPILFFLLGVLAWVLKSDLEVPQPLPKLFSLWLLLSIGFRGGAELRHAGLAAGAGTVLAAALVAAVVVPVLAFFVLRLRLDALNAAAVAATYGSVSAVTFLAADAFLQRLALPEPERAGGYMVAALALMESPAIVIGVLLARLFGKERKGGAARVHWRELLRESFLNGSVFLLVGALGVGLLTSDKGREAMRPFVEGLFPGVLCFFLLDMGLVAARRLGELRRMGAFLVGFALVTPLASAALALCVSRLLHFTTGDGFLFTVLCASASYIAVPAAMRQAVPEANPSLYVAMALGVTFPFNLTLGIPLYHAALRALGG